MIKDNRFGFTNTRKKNLQSTRSVLHQHHFSSSQYLMLILDVLHHHVKFYIYDLTVYRVILSTLYRMSGQTLSFREIQCRCNSAGIEFAGNKTIKKLVSIGKRYTKIGIQKKPVRRR